MGCGRKGLNLYALDISYAMLISKSLKYWTVFTLARNMFNLERWR